MRKLWKGLLEDWEEVFEDGNLVGWRKGCPLFTLIIEECEQSSILQLCIIDAADEILHTLSLDTLDESEAKQSAEAKTAEFLLAGAQLVSPGASEDIRLVQMIGDGPVLFGLCDNGKVYQSIRDLSKATEPFLGWAPVCMKEIRKEG